MRVAKPSPIPKNGTFLQRNKQDSTFTKGTHMNKVGRSSTATEQFGQTAVKLSQGPLGIIALFIVLIHGFASLVLGFAENIGEENRSILVWFLVLFPVFVFTVFAWLVSTCHQKLYPPGAYTNEEIFRDLALPWGESAFDTRNSLAIPPNETPTLTTNYLVGNAMGNLYWLGHDLMWTADTLLRQGPVEQIIIGLDQALHHLAHVGLRETPIALDLQTLRAQIQFSKELSASLRDEYAIKIGAIIDRIGATLEATQGDFKIPPHWNRVRNQ